MHFNNGLVKLYLGIHRKISAHFSSKLFIISALLCIFFFTMEATYKQNQPTRTLPFNRMFSLVHKKLVSSSSFRYPFHWHFAIVCNTLPTQQRTRAVSYEYVFRYRYLMECIPSGIKQHKSVRSHSMEMWNHNKYIAQHNFVAVAKLDGIPHRDFWITTYHSRNYVLTNLRNFLPFFE